MTYNAVELLEHRRLLSSSIVADFNGVYPTDSVTFNGVSYFAANDGTHGVELWKSDGSADGTQLVRDLTPGPTGSDVQAFDIVNNRVIFFADVDPDHIGMFTTDGTSDGTKLLMNLGLKWGPPFTAVVGAPGSQRLVFSIETGHPAIPTHNFLWSTDGTAAGTFQLADFVSVAGFYDITLTNTDYQLPSSGGRAIFVGDHQLFATDGTIKGTINLSATTPALARLSGEWCWPGTLTPFMDKVAFVMTNFLEHTTNVFITDGTAGGTQSLLTLDRSLNNLDGMNLWGMYIAGDKLFIPEDFVVHDTNTSKAQALWVSDGTAQGSFKLMSMNMGATIDLMGSVNGKALFSAWDAEHGAELWISDGTLEGTQLLKDLNPGPERGWPNSFREVGGFTYFWAIVGRDAQNNGGHPQLWRTDGTEAGTKMVQDFPEYPESTYGLGLRTADGKILVTVHLNSKPELVIEKTLVYDPARMLKPVGELQSAVTLKQAVLRVFGTRGNDVIRIYTMPDNPLRFFVNINGKKREFNYSDVKKLIIYGYSGNDDIGFKNVNGMVAIRSSIFGGLGNDTINGGCSRDTIFGEQGNDSILGNGSADSIIGGDGDDIVLGGAANDTVNGENGSDTLYGGSGSDMLSGGNDESKDYLDGGDGADVVFGQAVIDTFFTPDDGMQLIDDVLMS